MEFRSVLPGTTAHWENSTALISPARPGRYLPDAVPPSRKKAKAVSPLLKTLREQKSGKLKGGIYHRIQIDLTYNSNHIEGSRLTHDQTRYIFETNTIGMTDQGYQYR